jgi:hypothetical protein
MTQEQLRTQWRVYRKGLKAHMASGDWLREAYPDMPEALHDLKCGAQTRAGTPCKQIALYAGGRCKFHGGLSTGPTTEAGKAQARENGKLGGRGRGGKPDPMNGLGKPYGFPTSQNATERSLAKPKPMKTARFGQWVGMREQDPTKPNPMRGLEKSTFDGARTGRVVGPPMDPVNSDIHIAEDAKVTVWVQCRDCTNLSAGYKCLIPATGQTFPNMGQPRGCVYFAKFK